ncbi:hypothetical protein [Dialister invisus]|uniref:hypothetical protein n=1 Tax=Dialister invisus TaxID=218538 RepID=UPI00265F762E|nr:hypothetical protein [Dialister invisus]
MEDAAHYIGAVDEFAAVDDYPYSNRGCGCHGPCPCPTRPVSAFCAMIFEMIR